MPIYETVYILRPDLSKNQTEQINQDFKDIISKVDAAVKFGREEYWGVRTLAYRIRKQRKGHYLMFNYEGQSAIVPELERRMRLNEDVLRYMTILLREMPTEPSVMMKSAEEDDTVRRPRRDNRSFDNSDDSAKAAEVKTETAEVETPAEAVEADAPVEVAETNDAEQKTEKEQE